MASVWLWTAAFEPVSSSTVSRPTANPAASRTASTTIVVTTRRPPRCCGGGAPGAGCGGGGLGGDHWRRGPGGRG
ncbi:MAG: hypothetical protein U5R31_12695 [Acidimicrobiia bacterium]|nr:hypothetical protein [Acidimicrobiia bacterium]